MKLKVVKRVVKCEICGKLKPFDQVQHIEMKDGETEIDICDTCLWWKEYEQHELAR